MLKSLSQVSEPRTINAVLHSIARLAMRIITGRRGGPDDAKIKNNFGGWRRSPISRSATPLSETKLSAHCALCGPSPTELVFFGAGIRTGVVNVSDRCDAICGFVEFFCWQTIN